MTLLTNFLLTTGMVVSVIIIFTLLSNKKNEAPYRILVTIFLALFFIPFQNYGEFNGIKFIYAVGFLVADLIGFLIGPLLIIYIKSLYQNDINIVKTHLRHFIPLVVYGLFITLPFFISIWTDKTLFTYLTVIERYNFVLHLQAIYLLFYCWMALQLLGKYEKIIKQNYSNLSAKDLTWIKLLLWGLIAILSIDLLLVIYELCFGTSDWDLSYFITIFMIALILYLGYYGYSQSQILLPERLANELKNADSLRSTSSKSHHLVNSSAQEVEQLKTRLYVVLEQEKAYLNEDITLDALARLLPTTDKKLSALLNHHIHVPFYDFINQYRVEAVKEKMVDTRYAHYTLLAIAYDCGFKSKTSFNRTFKKVTGFSPSAYKKQLSD